SSFLSPHGSPHLPHLHSFPTRRSSDLSPRRLSAALPTWRRRYAGCRKQPMCRLLWESKSTCCKTCPAQKLLPMMDPPPHACLSRSEEHTSELQSPYDLVCRLLLEKKKK